MGILQELTSATGNKQSNLELVKRCIDTPALLHTVSEGLRTGTPKAQLDCAQIMLEVARRRPELVGNFVGDFVDASRNANKRLAKLGFTGLAVVTSAAPADVFAERDYLLGVAKDGESLAVDAAAVIAALCGSNANYRGKLIGNLLRLLPGIGDDDLVKWLTAVGPAVEGSADGYKRLELALGDRRERLDEANKKKVDKLMLKLERSTVKKKK